MENPFVSTKINFVEKPISVHISAISRISGISGIRIYHIGIAVLAVSWHILVPLCRYGISLYRYKANTAHSAKPVYRYDISLYDSTARLLYL